MQRTLNEEVEHKKEWVMITVNINLETIAKGRER
jgi:hypothetical protein